MPVLEFTKQALSGLRPEHTDHKKSGNGSKDPKLYESWPETFPDGWTVFLVLRHRSLNFRN